MNSKQQKAYDAQLDKMNLTDSQRDGFDHSAKRSLIDFDTYQNTDSFSLHGYSLSQVMDDIVLAQYVDLCVSSLNQVTLFASLTIKELKSII